MHTQYSVYRLNWRYCLWLQVGAIQVASQKATVWVWTPKTWPTPLYGRKSHTCTVFALQLSFYYFSGAGEIGFSSSVLLDTRFKLSSYPSNAHRPPILLAILSFTSIAIKKLLYHLHVFRSFHVSSGSFCVCKWYICINPLVVRLPSSVTSKNVSISYQNERFSFCLLVLDKSERGVLNLPPTCLCQTMEINKRLMKRIDASWLVYCSHSNRLDW
jgi:hypothetical protein